MNAPASVPGTSPPHCLALDNALSVDVEDYFQVEAFADFITPEAWPQFPRRVLQNTLRVLDLLAKYDARATFFVLGWVAEQEPQLVREIMKAGHEIGCHSYLHRCIFRLTPAGFREDTRRAKSILEDAAGCAVLGYRAPTFSIVPASLWALPILAEEGFKYDSSVFPVRHDVYGIPTAPRFMYEWQAPDGQKIVEVPPTTARFLGTNLAAAGGGYMRILPESLIKWAHRSVSSRERQPLVLYFHPWEIDAEQPRLNCGWKARFRHYFNLHWMEERLGAVLSRGRFVTLGELVQKRQQSGPLPVQALLPTP